MSDELTRVLTFPEHAQLPLDGPWVDEPDKIQWVDPATGLDCLVRRNMRNGVLCGYVGVPAEHPAFGLGYDEVQDEYENIWVHGGLTFADSCDEDGGDEAICHVPFPGRPDKVWWFGFDCHHGGDKAPALDARFIAMGAAHLVDTSEVYRTVEYVQKDVARLASQLMGLQKR
jgi:hypothetical protein